MGKKELNVTKYLKSWLLTTGERLGGLSSCLEFWTSMSLPKGRGKVIIRIMVFPLDENFVFGDNFFFLGDNIFLAPLVDILQLFAK